MLSENQHLKELNPSQREAALHIAGPLLIVAGAGAGKTKTITHRILNLIKNGIPPEKILAVTFTNKAAKEMRERVISALGEESSRERTSGRRDGAGQRKSSGEDFRGESAGTFEALPFISTFHSLGVHIIKENARVLGHTKYFTILDESDANTLIKETLKELELDPKQYDPKRIRGVISREKGRFTHLEEFVGEGTWGGIIARVWHLYEKRKMKENALDFDDLLLKATKLLKENEKVRKIYQETWTHIHIDEYQDTNEVQYLMSKLLCGENKNICAVGDADQCLVKGTKIKMASGSLQVIEKIKKGDLVLSNYGSGNFRPAKVVKKTSKKFSGDLIRIETETGKILSSTPDHVHFAGYRLGAVSNIHLNYLMYKKGVGWRLGTTSLYTKGQRKPIAGFIQRSNQEHADATWVVATHRTAQEARIEEYISSLKYQIPTLPFMPRKGLSVNGYVHDKDALKKVFSSVNENGAHKLLADLGLSLDHPHHQPQVHNSNRRNVNITLCADKRGRNPMHLVSTFGNDLLGRKKIESLGLSVRAAKNGTASWRFETVRADYKTACLLAAKIGAVYEESNFVFRARLGGDKTNTRDGNSLPCLPAGSVMPGMALFTENGYDVVKKVSRLPATKIEIFDIDIEKTHNFLANGIFTHNCIYSWRGASLRNVLNFEKDYPNAKIIMLEENYRSTQNILEAANEIIKKNKYRPERNLFTKNKTGEKIGLYEALEENDEAEFVATKILELADGRENAFERRSAQADAPSKAIRQQANMRAESESIFSNIAILYRANFQSRVLEEAMLRYNIPYQVLGVRFFERKEIKDTLAYLRAALNPESLSDIKRIINFPTRGIGKTTLAKIFSTAPAGQAGQKEGLPAKTLVKIGSFYALLAEIKEKITLLKPSEIIKYVVKKSGLENELLSGGEEELERLENIKELATLALKYDELKSGVGVEKLLEDASLASDQDSLINYQGESLIKNGVKLMTVHAAKGLEFKYIFITGLEDGLFPHARAGERETPEDREEERRLFYVALTRAKEKLFLSFANFRTIFGSRSINAPSEFIADIPADLLEKEGDNKIKTIYI